MDSVFHSHLGELAALATALLWTFSTLAWTSAGRQIGSLAVNFNRLVIAFLLLSIYCKLHLGSWLPPDADGKTWITLLMSGVLGFFFADICCFKSLLIIGPRLTLLLLATTPPMTAIFASFYLHDSMHLFQWIAMAVTLSGVAWVVLEQPETPKESHHRKDFAWGVLLALAGSSFAAAGSVLSKQGIGNYDAFAATFIRIIGGLICFLPVLVISGRWWQVGRSVLRGHTMLIVLGGTIVGPVVGVAMSLEALRHCSAGVAMTIINTMPVMILPLVIIFYKEKVSPRAAVGAVISVIGIAMLMSDQWWVMLFKG
jgi:drug/metabolite transporter (DMT)-like permease